MCSKTFDDSIFEEFFEAKYGLARRDIAKINIKGVFQIWCRDGSYHEVPLKEGHAWTREGCKSCPDFAAEHADISTGGIGELKDWTLTVIRSDLGQEIIDEMVAGGALEVRPGEDDPAALALMGRLSTVLSPALAGHRCGRPQSRRPARPRAPAASAAGWPTPRPATADHLALRGIFGRSLRVGEGLEPPPAATRCATDLLS